MKKTLAGSERARDYLPFVIRTLLVLGLVALALLLWRVREAFLVAFASILVAILLSAAAACFENRLRMRRSWSLAATGAIILVAFALAGWLVGAQLRVQTAQFIAQLPDAVESLEQRFGVSFPTPGTSGEADGGRADGRSESGGSRSFSLLDDLLGQLLSWSRTFLAVATTAVLVLITGIYLAISPELYRRGFVKLFPTTQHQRVRGTLDACGSGLLRWLLAQLVAMTIVGLLAGLGTWWIGLPAPLALGLFAGLTEFVPTVGPIVGAVPALLFALTQGMGSFLWTLLLFVAIQQVESNLVMPLLQKRMVRIPPALFLVSVLSFGLLFGILGILLAAPLTVVAFVAVSKLYVRDVLGEPTSLPGEE